jgi:hypothetical protein
LLRMSVKLSSWELERRTAGQLMKASSRRCL